MKSSAGVSRKHGGARWLPNILLLPLAVASWTAVGPLQQTLHGLPMLRFGAALVLFLIPGYVIYERWFSQALGGAGAIPASFAFSVSLFGVLGVPFLILHESLSAYLFLCGVVVALAIAFSLVDVLIKRPASDTARTVSGEDLSEAAWWLWVPFTCGAITLGYLAHIRYPMVDGDTWDYLAWIREYLNTRHLTLYDPYFGERVAAISRVKINGWLLEQAALSRVAGIDPVTLVLHYLEPTLVVVALLAFYALGVALFGGHRTALLAATFYVLFLLGQLEPTPQSLGGEIVARVVQDKFLTRYLFLPVALAFALCFVRTRRVRHLLGFAFLCWAVVTVHPVGLAVIAISVGGFGIVHLLCGLRERKAWLETAGLALPFVSLALGPLLYVLFRGIPPTAKLYDADIGGTPPEVLANMVFVRPEWRHIFRLGDGLYIMHPYLLLIPAIALGYVAGVPFLALRLRRSLPARLLLGTLAVSTLVCYLPPLATFVGNDVIAPGQLYRMAWPIPLATVLTDAWMASELLRRLSGTLTGRGLRGLSSGLLAVVLVVVLAGFAAPAATSGAREIDSGPPPLDRSFFFDPIFRWMQHNIRQPAVVMAPDHDNIAIPAYSSYLNVISFRGDPILEHLGQLEKLSGDKIRVPRRDLDVHKFYSGPTLLEAYRILRHYHVKYVLVYAETPLNDQMMHLPGFVHIPTPSQRYSLYRVDYRTLAGHLGVSPPANP